MTALDPIPSSLHPRGVLARRSRAPCAKPRDFERFAGQTVQVSLVPGEGRRRYTGTLLGIEDGSVSLEVDGQRVSVSYDDIRKCTIKPDFSQPGANK